ncbi:MAG: hypothetical protein PVI07_17150 [Anaerolineae bacterium]|jgi:hypothetical protein
MQPPVVSLMTSSATRSGKPLKGELVHIELEDSNFFALDRLEAGRSG